ncbi:MAG: Crp/Fnr family transcriptional regulator [Tannerellaceae bacterium]
MNYQSVLKCPIFKGLNQDDVCAMIDHSHAREKTFQEKAIIALQGEVCNNLMIVVEGSVQGEMIDNTGKLIVIDQIHAPNPIAHAFLYADNHEFPVNIVATSHTKILYFERDAFVKLLQQNATLLINFLRIISNTTRFLSQKLQFHVFKTIKSKIAAYFIKKYNPENGKVYLLDETQQELADRFGVARPSLARAIGEMVKEGVIEMGQKQLTVIDVKQLIAIAGS